MCEYVIQNKANYVEFILLQNLYHYNKYDNFFK